MKKATIKELRQDVLELGQPFLIRIFKRMDRGSAPFLDGGEEKLFDALMKLVEKEESPVSFKFEGNDVNERIDSLVKAISCGQITPQQGAVLMGILRSGFEVTEVSELTKQLEASGLIQLENKQ